MSVTTKKKLEEANKFYKKDKKEDKKLETLQDYKDAGYTVGDMVGMSNPPTYFLTSPDGETITFRPKMKIKPNMPKREAKGGAIRRRGGGIAKRGFGITK